MLCLRSNGNRLSLLFSAIFSQPKRRPSLSSFAHHNPLVILNTEPSLPHPPKPDSISSAPSCHLTYHNVISANRVITRHIRSGDLNSALRVFESMTVKTTVTWNSVLAGYSSRRGKTKEARQLFDRIPEPDIFSYNIMLACYLHSTRLFFDQMPVKDTASWNTMISGLSLNGLMDQARDLFLVTPVKNSVSWNAMISGYVESGDLDLAKQLF